MCIPTERHCFSAAALHGTLGVPTHQYPLQAPPLPPNINTLWIVSSLCRKEVYKHYIEVYLLFLSYCGRCTFLQRDTVSLQQLYMVHWESLHTNTPSKHPHFHQTLVKYVYYFLPLNYHNKKTAYYQVSEVFISAAMDTIHSINQCLVSCDSIITSIQVQ